jgi:hypothetical protein
MDSQGAKSVISEDMQNLTHGKEDLSNQIRGHKANISNPSASSCQQRCLKIETDPYRHKRKVEAKQRRGY